ncbi:MFS transporter, partial [Lactobacillus sp. XV13L]|nr:MFS transporter [Lactobacillus sp. XV13L]
MSSSKSKNKILIGIIALAVVSRLIVSTSPALAVIGKAFPQASATQVESVATIGDLAAVISALIFGKLLDYWNFKRLGIISVTILALGGLSPLIWHHSINNLLIAGFVAGLGAGGITTILPSLQSYIYHGEALANMLGRVVALENGSSMVLLFAGGLLASQYWLHNYYLFFLALISLIIVAFTLPNRHPGQETTADMPTSPQVMSRKTIISIGAYMLTASMMVFLEAVLYNKNAIYIQHFHLGTPVLSGKIMMLDGGAAIVVGLTLK